MRQFLQGWSAWPDARAAGRQRVNHRVKRIKSGDERLKEFDLFRVGSFDGASKAIKLKAHQLIKEMTFD